jgi:hypothetical protein
LDNLIGNKNATIAYVGPPTQSTVPRSYGRVVTAIADSIGTGRAFEDSEGVIRFVTIAGKKEGELTRN